MTTAESLCKKYNNKLKEEHAKIEEAEDDFARKVDAEVASLTAAKLPKVVCAPEILSRGWAYRYRKTFGWVRRATNTAGVYLPFDHPKMMAARQDFQSDLDRGIDRRLYLNVDQVWRSAYSGAKHTFRKDLGHKKRFY